MKFLRYIMSGEFLFAAFILSSVFKSAFGNMFIDISLMLFILNIFIAFKRLFIVRRIKKSILIPVSLFSFFIGISLFSLYYSSSVVYSNEKFMLLITFTLWSFLGPFIFLNNKESLTKFFHSFIIIITLTAVYVLFTYYSTSEASDLTRVGVNGSNSLGLARMSSLGIIIILIQYLLNKHIKITKKIYSVLGVTILTLVVLLTGSRMPLLSLIIILVLTILLQTFYLNKHDFLFKKKSIKSLIVLTFVFSVIPFFNSTQTTIERFSNLFSDSGFGSYSLRTDLYRLAINSFNNKLIFGNGLGSFAIEYNGIDERYYPHNILLEILAELGLVGFLVFLLLIILPFILYDFSKFNNLQLCILMLFIYTFMNANTTGDLNDNRVVFTFLALLYMYSTFYSKSSEKSNSSKRDYKINMGVTK